MCHTEVHLHPRARKNQTILEFALDVSPDARFRAHARRLFRQRSNVLLHRRAAPRADHHIALPGQSGTRGSTAPSISRPPGSKCARKRRNATRRRLSRPGSLFSNRRPSGWPGVGRNMPLLPLPPDVRCSAPSAISRAVSSPNSITTNAPPPLGLPVDEVLASRRGCLPGFRALDDRVPAIAEAARALCQRLCAHGRQTSRAKKLRTPGFRCGVRCSAGRISIPPTT